MKRGVLGGSFAIGNILSAAAKIKELSLSDNELNKEPETFRLESFTVESGIDDAKNVLFLVPKDESVKVLDTSAVPGQPTISPMKVASTGMSSAASSLPPPQILEDDNCSLVVPPLDDSAAKRKLRREMKKKFLSDWFDLPQQTITPDIERDLQILRLRGFADKRRFYKSADNSDPTHFQFARVVEGGLHKPIGENSRLFISGSRKKGRTLVQELLKDQEIRRWTKERSERAKAEEKSGGRHCYRKRRKAQNRFLRAAKKTWQS